MDQRDMDTRRRDKIFILTSPSSVTRTYLFVFEKIGVAEEDVFTALATLEVDELSELIHILTERLNTVRELQKLTEDD